MVDGWMHDGYEMDGACGEDDSDEERWSDDDDDEGEQMNSVDLRQLLIAKTKQKHIHRNMQCNWIHRYLWYFFTLHFF